MTEIDTNLLADFAPNETLSARLAERHKRIIGENLSQIKDKFVIDLAASNGRWSYAAAAAGARKVRGVEGRPEKVDEARKFATGLSVDNVCTFECGDMFDWLHSYEGEQADTVFCLGVYYHVMDHYHLLRLIARLRPKCIIIDSGFVRSFRFLVHVQTENPNLYSSTLPAYATQSQELVGIVSLGLLNQMAWNCGYRVEPIVWNPKSIANPKSVHDYIIGRRFTLRLVKDDSIRGYDNDWKERWRPALVTLNPRLEKLLDPKTALAAEDARAKLRPSFNEEPKRG